MNTLILLRHSLTEATEKRLYCGSTDLPLSVTGCALAGSYGRLALPSEKTVTVSSGMRRADETLFLLTGRKADITLPELAEFRFGDFEMKSYDQLRHEPAYIRWIEDETGLIHCPGGQSRADFEAQVMSGCKKLLRLPADIALCVCHGGVIVCLMEHWFPNASRNYYQWQPSACRGYRITLRDRAPIGFEEV